MVAHFPLDGIVAPHRHERACVPCTTRLVSVTWRDVAVMTWHDPPVYHAPSRGQSTATRSPGAHFPPRSSSAAAALLASSSTPPKERTEPLDEERPRRPAAPAVLAAPAAEALARSVEEVAGSGSEDEDAEELRAASRPRSEKLCGWMMCSRT